MVDSKPQQVWLNLMMKIMRGTQLRQGQVCKVLAPANELESKIVYLITSESIDETTGKVKVVELKDLQRNVSHPEKCHHITYPADELVVVANSLEAYVKSWNY